MIGSLLSLLTMPARTRIADDRFAQAELRVAEETLRLAAQTRRAYVRAVAARQIVATLGEAKANAEASAELAGHLTQTGAMNKLDQARRDYVFIMSSYNVTPGGSLPNVAEMTDFNMWTWNSRVFPGIDVLPARLGDRVRIRMGNLTMTNHPIHLHGHDFRVTMTDGGWIPETAQIPEATTDVPVGAVRALEFVADAPGDWAFHCHKSHHTMNAMWHKTKTFIGVPQSALSQALDRAAPTAMAMGTTGMADMAEMSMPLPANTLPMMTGFGQFGAIEMGGMFTVVKVREGLAPDDYKDPGPYKNPIRHRRL